MARVPPKPIDFAPAWLNLTSSDKKQQKLAQPISSSAFSLSILNNQVTNKSLGNSAQKHNSKYGWSGSNLKPNQQSGQCEQWKESIGFASNKGFDAVDTSASNSSTLNAAPPSPIQRLDNIQNEAEFPMLGSHDFSAKTTKVCDTAWSKPPIFKPLSTKITSNQNTKASSMKNPTNSIYKSFVPKSSASGHKPYRRNLNIPNSSQSVEAECVTSKTEPITSQKHASTKSQGRSSVGEQADDNHSMLALTVKRHRRGKNIFLRELKEDECESEEVEEEVDQIENGSVEILPSPSEAVAIEDCMELQGHDRSPYNAEDGQEAPLTVDYWDAVYDHDDEDDNDVVVRDDGVSGAERVGREGDHYNLNMKDAPLSSSLEAEYRLLREMGWTNDRSCLNESPLTEDEIREFFTRNKRKGLLGVPSLSHRTTAFRDALTAWSLSNKHTRRHLTSKSTVDLSSPLDSTESQFSDSDSD